jgi:ankyrin repeat protein
MWAAEMFRAAKLGHENKVSRLLDADPTLLGKEDDDGNFPLMLTAQAGHLGVVKLLVHRGASINASGEGQLTALHYAALDGHAEIVAFLLSKGAQANVCSCLDLTPLMMAARKGHLGVVQMLLEHMGGRGLDDEDQIERTALIHAAEGGHEDMVAFILSRGAQAGITSTAAAVALVTAVCRGHLGMCTMLAQHIEEQHGHQDATNLYAAALFKAAINGYEELVAFLLGRGARADIRDGRGTTPLIKAAAYGYMRVVQMLLPHTGTRGLEENDDSGETALYAAAENGHEAMVTFLLRQGARADVRNMLGATPLMAASGGAHLEVVKLLLQHRGGEGLAERDPWGSGVLHFAVEDACRFSWRHRERGPSREHLVQFLLCAGADARATDMNGQTPYANAVANNHVGCVRVFEVGGQHTHLKRAQEMQQCVPFLSFTSAVYQSGVHIKQDTNLGA